MIWGVLWSLRNSASSLIGSGSHNVKVVAVVVGVVVVKDVVSLKKL